MLPYGFLLEDNSICNFSDERLGFATIWIFARLRLKNRYNALRDSFATIWIFARLRRATEDEPKQPSFAIIWIFARLRLGIQRLYIAD